MKACQKLIKKLWQRSSRFKPSAQRSDPQKFLHQYRYLDDFRIIAKLTQLLCIHANMYWGDTQYLIPKVVNNLSLKGAKEVNLSFAEIDQDQ